MLRSLILSREKGCLDVPNSLFRVVEQPLRSHETVVSVMRESLFRSFRMLLCDGYCIYMRVIYMFPRLCVSVLRISRVNIFYRHYRINIHSFLAVLRFCPASAFGMQRLFADALK